jgi:hypothetical protein
VKLPDPPEPPTGVPADPASYERRVLAVTEEVLRRILASEARMLTSETRRELREVRLEGSYPDTRMVVTYWDGRNPARAREHTYSTSIWPPPDWVAKHGIDPPERRGGDLADHALGG